MNSSFSKKLLLWYVSRRRALPWREHPQPYAVWVAEVMAQQTRLESMLPYYRRWMRRFPSIRSLAKSDEQEVLSLWEGLGYYRRAQNLRETAEVLVEKFGGRLPADVQTLQSLPGIGPYTAGAIASLAFGLDAIAVDGNASRVLARLFDVKQSIDSAAGKKKVCELAAQFLPSGRAAEYNQALMDLGAEICLPHQPKCDICPLIRMCHAYARGNQEQRPVRAAARKTPLRQFAAAVIRKRGKVLILKRPGAGLLGGMWEFPNTALSSPRRARWLLRLALRKDLGTEFKPGERLEIYEHAFSHFRARLQVFGCALNGKRLKIKTQRDLLWLKPEALAEVPMGNLDRRIANALMQKAG